MEEVLYHLDEALKAYEAERGVDITDDDEDANAIRELISRLESE